MFKNERYFTTRHTGGAPNGIAILRTDGSLLVQPDRGAHLIIEGVGQAALEENAAYLEWREEQGGTPGKPPDDGSPVSYCDINGCSLGRGHSGAHK